MKVLVDKQNPEDYSQNPKKKKLLRPLNKFIQFSSLGMQMLGFIFFGYYLGHKIDQWLENATPWGIIIGILFGVVGSMAYVMVRVNKMNK
ncbi:MULTISPECIES: AtpZ/AtpI family protein [unclassified Persicobacter]|uniref:AtpZ/AtpI family protein n=1 Tax=Persicobacter sp. CCB-QB2 TaxID=1561025 RepID=UPI00090435B3